MSDTEEPYTWPQWCKKKHNAQRTNQKAYQKYKTEWHARRNSSLNGLNEDVQSMINTTQNVDVDMQVLTENTQENGNNELQVLSNNEQNQDLSLTDRQASPVPSSSNARHDWNRDRMMIEYENQSPKKKRKRLNAVNDRVRSVRRQVVSVNDFINVKDIKLISIGKMTVKCTECEAMHFQSEHNGGTKAKPTYYSCCDNGKIKLNLSTDTEFNPELKALFKRTGEGHANFHHKIVKLNSNFSFAYMTPKNSRLPGVFNNRIEGEMLIHMPSLATPQNGKSPVFGQLWIVETADALNERMDTKMFDAGDKKLLEFLHTYLRSTNQYAAAYKMLADIDKEQIEFAKRNNTNPAVCKLVLRSTTNEKNDAWKKPAANKNDVAAVFVCDKNGDVPSFQFEVQPRITDGIPYSSSVISKEPQVVEPLAFPLFHPTGKECTYRYGMKQNEFDQNSKNMSLAQYIRFKMAIRPESKAYPFNPLLFGGKLFCVWIVWAYVTIEHLRLQWNQMNQKQLKISTYHGLADYVAQVCKKYSSAPGTIRVLPSSFTNGPRFIGQKLQDALAMFRKYGKPDLFVTYTCNPNHPDFTKNLETRQKPCDRPDITARVFKEHLDLFIQLFLRGYFGVLKCYVGVIEFQKRGLPHFHMLITFEENDWNLPSKIDQYISAEIPDKECDEELHNLVLDLMIHKPCGEVDPDAVCMVKGRCKRHYPKDFCDNTMVTDDDYPKLRRRDNKKSYPVKLRDGRMVNVDSRNVVPYSPYLLKKFGSHINVMPVASLRVVKYLYKYLFKQDQSTLAQIVNDNNTFNHDEIKDFLSMRYLCSQEAAWRLFEYKLFHSSDSCERLPVHLPMNQTIVHALNEEDEQLKVKMEKDSKLLAFFNLNKKKRTDLTYDQVATSYKWVTTKEYNGWEERKRGGERKLPRIYPVDIKKAELFYLRTLLFVVKGPTCYEDMRRDPSDPSIVYPTYRDACVARGLIVDNALYVKAMEEAAVFNKPRKLRSFFAKLVVYCELENPMDLWEQFKDDLCEDLLYKNNGDKPLAYDEGMISVLGYMVQCDCNLNQYPEFEARANELSFDPNVPWDVVKLAREGLKMNCSLNVQQRKIFDSVMNRVNNPCDQTACYFVDGPGGSGKSFLFQTLYKTIGGANKKVIIMAWSGIAASLYPIGRTCHNVFKLDFPFESESTSGVMNNSKLADDLREASLIIWDEAPMAPRRALEVVDNKLQEIMENNVPFGGKVILLGGDFRQLPPVIPDGTKFDVLRTTIKASSLWKLFTTFKLTENVRADGNADFAKRILEIGNGTANDSNNMVRLPVQNVAKDDLVEEVFGHYIKTKNFTKVASSAIVATRNDTVDSINSEVIKTLCEIYEHKTYQSVDTVNDSDAVDTSMHKDLPDYLDALKPSGFPASKLIISVNSIVMLIRNLNINEGLCNGTRLIVREVRENIIVAEKLTNRTNTDDDIVFIPRISLTYDGDLFSITRRQFPIRAAFALTINKSQGQTFDNLGIYLADDVFNHGHLYVALSRTRNWENIKLVNNDENGGLTKNIVYIELFGNLSYYN